MTKEWFAPAISYKMVYTMRTLGNFVVTAKDPDGQGSDPTYIPEVRGIDPSIC
jgi:xylan 1,4-beta-xylosidase